MAISCCRYCVAPKRHPGCHGHCSEYIEEKAKHDEQVAAEAKRRKIEYGLTAQFRSSIRKAYSISHRKG